MSLSLFSYDLQILEREADQAARRLVRRLRLPPSDLADLRQELLLDLIARVPGFDPDRGTLGAFAGTILNHKGADIARRVYRQRQLFGAEPISIDDPDQAGLCEAMANDAGVGSLLSSVRHSDGSTDLARDVTWVVSTLPAGLRNLCALLQSEAPTAACKASGLSRATFYRRLHEVRLRFLVEGVDATG